MNSINNHYSANIKLSLEPTIHGLINICLSFDAIVNRTIYIHETRLLLYILRFVNKQFMHLNTVKNVSGSYRFIRSWLSKKIIKIMHSHILLFTVFLHECQMELHRFMCLRIGLAYEIHCP